MAERQAPKIINDNSALDLMREPGGELSRDVNGGWPRNDLPFAGTETSDASPEDNLRSIVSEVSGGDGDQGFVSIWKLNEITKRFEYVVRREAADFLTGGADFLAKNFGSGEYELRVYTATSKLFKRPRLTISAAAAAFAQRSAEVKNSGSVEMSQLVGVMAQGFQKLGELIVQSRPPQDSREKMLDELIKMKQIFGAQQNNTDPLALITGLAGVFQKLQPRAENENPFFGLMEQFMPVIINAVQKPEATSEAAQAVAALPSTPQPIAQLNPQARQQSQPTLTPQQQGEKAMSMQLKMQLVYLCAQAARDSDPAPYAAIIVDQVPAEALTKLVNDADWMQALAKFHPGVLKHPEWFNELYQHVLEEMSPEQDLQDSQIDDISTGITTGNPNVSESGDGESY